MPLKSDVPASVRPGRPAGAMAVLLWTLLTGCHTGPIKVGQEPPTLQVESLRIEQEVVHIGLLVHNRNDHSLFIEKAVVAMRIDGDELFNAGWRLDLDIGPRGRELVGLEAPAMQPAAGRLSDIGATPGTGVAYELSSEIVLGGQRDARKGQQGFLYPVPGQPGHYR